jgi:signal transduction histidine kinase
MKKLRRSTTALRPGSSARLALAAAIAAVLPTFHAQAVDIIKANTTTALNLNGSWTTVQPTSSDVAV